MKYLLLFLLLLALPASATTLRYEGDASSYFVFRLYEGSNNVETQRFSLGDGSLVFLFDDTTGGISITGSFTEREDPTAFDFLSGPISINLERGPTTDSFDVVAGEVSKIHGPIDGFLTFADSRTVQLSNTFYPLISGFDWLSGHVGGSIDSVTFSDNDFQAHLVRTPEPMSLLLVGFGLPFVFRWRKRD